jgi:hypothetical protein
VFEAFDDAGAGDEGEGAGAEGDRGRNHDASQNNFRLAQAVVSRGRMGRAWKQGTSHDCCMNRAPETRRRWTG